MSDPVPPARAAPPLTGGPSRLACAVAGALPFLLVYGAHWLSGDGVPTGFVQGDQPYYTANGRAAFERGNGLAYPNPFDPDPAAPAIYVHWFPWLLGFGVTVLGFDPGVQYVAVGVISAVLCAWLMFRIVEEILPDRRYLSLLYVLVMWGGGLLAVAAVVGNLVAGRPALEGLMAYNPADGWWFLNWGRNLVYATEATYHAIVAAVWLAVLRRRWSLAVAGAAALATTHPFSGVQHLLILAAWFGGLLAFRRSREALPPLLATVGFLAAMAWYYGVFLESYPQHARLREVWALAWTMPLVTMLLAYGPVAAAAAVRLRQDRGRLGEREAFLLVAAAVSFLLVKHDWFVRPHQPLHFTRGYVWTPLCLLALPLAQRGLAGLRERKGAAVTGAVAAALLALAAADNAAFILHKWRNPYSGVAFYVSRGEREMFHWADGQRLRGVLVTPYPNTSYLAATYTRLRPYYGHPYNTPDYAARMAQVESWLTTGAPGLAPPADYVLLERAHLEKFKGRAAWEPAHENDEFVLLRRRSAQPP